MEPSDHHQILTELMIEKGFDVRFFKTLDALMTELRAVRVSCIILGDEGPEVNVLNAISTLQAAPEIQGAKILLSNSKSSALLLETAVYAGFRDVLPFDLPSEKWVERFIFSTGVEMTPLSKPDSTVQASGYCKIEIPARISRISQNTILIESRVDPNPKDNLDLIGPIAKTMAAEKIDLKVKTIVNHNLTYRFSRGLKCSYQPFPPNETAIKDTLTEIRNMDVGPRIKVFLAIQSPALRSSLIRQLDPSRFEIRTALQKKNLIDEPQYFSPDILIISETLVSGTNQERFTEMARILPKQTVVVIVGAPKIQASVENLVSSRKLLIFKNLPINIKEILTTEVEKINQPYSKNKNYCFIPPDHEYSKVMLIATSQIDLVHKFGLRLRTIQNIGKFGLIYCSIPSLANMPAQTVLCKVLDITEDGSQERLTYIVDLRFCSLESSQSFEVTQSQQNPPDPITANTPKPKLVATSPNEGTGTAPNVQVSQQPIRQPPQTEAPPLNGLLLFLTFTVGLLCGIIVVHLIQRAAIW